jgi:hypothetical protein
MPAEHHNDAAERLEHREHVQAEIKQAGGEKVAELLRNQPELGTENSHERANRAREVINQPPPQESAPEPPVTEIASARPTLPFLNHKLNYVQTLASVQRRLKPASRSFSKVIHAPIVEKASEALEKTVARPSVTFGATWTALLVGGIFYFTARRYGFELSGSEVTLSFIVGAVVGLAIEAAWRTFHHRPH